MEKPEFDDKGVIKIREEDQIDEDLEWKKTEIQNLSKNI